MSTYMVAVDESKYAENAFETAVQHMKPTDTLFVITVVVRNDHGKLLKTPDWNTKHLELMNDQKKHARTLLLSYREKMKHRGLTNFSLILSVGSHPGHNIVRAAELNSVQLLFIGSRGLGKIKRILMGSVSKYVVEHAKCNVIVVRSEPVPVEVHEVSRDKVKEMEEQERKRRIDEIAKETFNRSQLDKNIVILAEEEERWRRIHEELEDEDPEKAKRAWEAAKMGVVIEEEEERKRRIDERRKETGDSDILIMEQFDS